MALQGIRVIELAGLAPAPFCGMILADFGASVIRVDKIGSSSSIDCLGHGKRSISLNLKHPKGVEVLKKMCKVSDVLIEPFRKGVMEKLGLGPNILMKDNPSLIYARLTGYGQSGPFSTMAGHDINYLAVSGVLSMLGRKGEKPTAPINLLADFAGGGLMCALGIVLALTNRERNGEKGKGQVVDASMVEGAAYVSSWLFRSRHKLPIWGNPRGQNILDTGSHYYETYETKDGGHVAVGALEPQFYDRLLDSLELSHDDVPQVGADNPEDCKRIMSERFLKKTRDEWSAKFDGTDACVTPVLHPEEVGSHHHNEERKSFFQSPKGDSDKENGEWIPHPSPRLSDTPGISQASLHSESVRPGEHTAVILKELGYADGEISFLEKDGVVTLDGMKKSKL